MARRRKPGSRGPRFSVAPAGTFLSTVPAGLAGVAARAIRTALPEASSVRDLENAVEFRASADPTEVGRLAFVKNSFRVFASGRFDPRTPPADVASALLAGGGVRRADPHPTPGARSFRVVVSHHGVLAPLPGAVAARLDAEIARHTGLRVARGGGDDELWLITRSDGRAYFGLRVSAAEPVAKVRKGELQPHLASLLCALSEPAPDDVFLDPFCGWGAIPLQRARWPAREIIAGDIDPGKIQRLRSRAGGAGAPTRFTIEVMDGRALRTLADRSIDKVVTDPPWGLFEEVDAPALYRAFLAECARVLREGGIAVIVALRSLPLADLVAGRGRLQLLDSFDFLLSGKKATAHALGAERLDRPALRARASP